MIQNKIELTKEEALSKIDNKFKALKQFLNEINSYYIEEDKMTNELIFDEVDYFGRQYMIKIPLKITNKNPQVIFRDDLTDINRLWELYSINTDITQPIYDKLQSNINDLGCSLYDSCCGGNDDYLWFDLSIDMKKFDKEILQKCSELWTNYNKELSKHII